MNQKLLLSAYTLFLTFAGCQTNVVSPAPGPDPVLLRNSDEWASLSEPGASHRLLAPLEGTWETEMTFWSSPDSEASQSKGRSSFNWIMGGRFIKEEVAGEILQQKFQGLGIMGYDNAKRRFTTMWVDSFNTGIATAEGTYSTDTHQFSFVGSTYDPLISSTKNTKSELDLLSNDKIVFRMFDVAPNGKEFKSLEIAYHRVG